MSTETIPSLVGVPDRLGRYELFHRLASGGMGSGVAKVMDFGIAKTRDHIRATQEGALRGKVRYSAPERIRGQEPDRRSDVWGLGVCLWELLALKPIFQKPDLLGLARAILSEEIAPPSQARSGAPATLDAIVERALRRELSKRYQTARDLARDLREWVRRYGESVDDADVGDWLRVLFPDREPARAERSALSTRQPLLPSAPPRSPAPDLRAPPPPQAAAPAPSADLLDETTANAELDLDIDVRDATASSALLTPVVATAMPPPATPSPPPPVAPATPPPPTPTSFPDVLLSSEVKLPPVRPREPLPPPPMRWRSSLAPGKRRWLAAAAVGGVLALAAGLLLGRCG